MKPGTATKYGPTVVGLIALLVILMLTATQAVAQGCNCGEFGGVTIAKFQDSDLDPGGHSLSGITIDVTHVGGEPSFLTWSKVGSAVVFMLGKRDGLCDIIPDSQDLAPCSGPTGSMCDPDAPFTGTFPGTSGTYGHTKSPPGPSGIGNFAISHVSFCSTADPCVGNQLPNFSGPSGSGATRSVTITDDQGINELSFPTLTNIEVEIVELSLTGITQGAVVPTPGSPTELNLVFHRPAGVNPGDQAIFNVQVDDGCTSVGFDPALDWYAGETPQAFRLDDNYPNPFNPETTIRFQVAEAGPVKVMVYDMLGRAVRTLVDQSLEAGYHEVTWDGTNASGASMASGMYLYRMEAGPFAASKTMLLLK